MRGKIFLIPILVFAIILTAQTIIQVNLNTSIAKIAQHGNLDQKSLKHTELGLLSKEKYEKTNKVIEEAADNYAYKVKIGPKPLSSNFKDWTISENVTLKDEVIILNENLVVEYGGNLTFINVTLYMKCSYDGEFIIRVEKGGRFNILNGSVITAYTSDNEFLFYVMDGAVLRMFDSELHECGYKDFYEGLTIYTDDAIIRNCTISKNYYGIYCYYSSAIIENCTVTENNKHGIYCHSSSVTIYNCIVTGNGGDGVDLRSSSTATISNCTTTKNSASGIYCGSSCSATISNCTTTENTWGIFCWYSTATISNCTIARNSENGIDCTSSSVTISWCNIFSNVKFGLKNNGPNLVDATYNWWGSPDGPEYKDESDPDDPEEIWENINYSPWLTKAIDYVAPTLKIVHPLENEYVKGLVTIDVTAFDLIGVANVSIYIDSELVHVYYDKPYSYEWNTADYLDGKHSIKAVAYDKNGNNSNKTVSVVVDNTIPTIGTISPANKSWINGVITIIVPADDTGSGIAYVAFYTTELQPTLLYNDTKEPYEYNWDTKLYAEGKQNLSVYAFDNVGNYRRITLEFYVDNLPPSVEVMFPTAGEYVEGEINIAVSAYDLGIGIEKVSFIIDETFLLNDTESPYECSFNSLSYSDGSHNITVIAYDKIGRNNKTSVIFYVDSTPPVISGTYPVQVRQGEAAIVNVTVIDAVSGVTEVILSFSVDEGETWKNITMTAKNGDVYEAIIPGQSAGKTVQFKVIAIDGVGNVAVTPLRTYKVTGFPAMFTILILAGVVGGTTAAVIFIVIRKRS